MTDQGHKGHRQRLRERFLNSGLDSMEDHTALELLLCYAIPRKDVNELAHELLKTFGSLSAVLDADKAALEQVPGMGESAAVLLKLIPAMNRRYLMDRTKTGKRLYLRDTDRAGAFFLPRFYGAGEEKVYAAFLDEHCRLLACKEVFEGSIGYTPVNVRKLVEAALRLKATNIILAHNHPDGYAVPSREDRESTRIISSALAAVQLRLLDHIIVAGDEYVSMEECGYFKDE